MSSTKKPDKDMGPEVKNLGGYRPGARLDAKPGMDRAVGYVRHVEIVICSPGVISRGDRASSGLLAKKVRRKNEGIWPHYALDLASKSH
jgi:hypothetical protein